MRKRMRVLVLCGGPSSEHEVSVNTARMVLKNMDKKKYQPSLAVIGRDGKWKFNSGSQYVFMGKALVTIVSKFDFVFIAMHGAFGEDGRIQAILESIGVPYSGSGVLSSAMAMDKSVSNTLYASEGLKVPEYVVLDKYSKNKNINLVLPVVVKPANGGSSVGVSIVKTKKDLRAAFRKAFKEGSRIIVQKYIKGRELTCGVIEKNSGELLALPPIEIVSKISAFYDYSAKYKTGGSEHIIPAKLSKEKTRKLKQLSLEAHCMLGCGGMSRSDFILDNSGFYILETNTIPGMTETSLLPQAAAVAGINFPSLLDLIISAGVKAGGRK